MSTTQANSNSRQEAIEILEAAIDDFENSEKYQAWVQLRSSFRQYSLRNTILIVSQKPDASLVAGYREWQRRDRQVKRGERSLKILAPVLVNRKPEDPEYRVDAKGRPNKKVVGFRFVSVFDVSQTDGEPLPAADPLEPLEGDSHERYLGQIEQFARELGYSFSFEPLDGPRGYCDLRSKSIVVDPTYSINQQVKTAIHEVVHALGVDSRVFSRAQAETIAETSAYIVAAGIGLDVTSYSAPYVSGWSDRRLRAASIAYIDYCAARVEVALGLRESAPAAPVALLEKSEVE